MTRLVIIDEDEALRDRLAGHRLEVLGVAGNCVAGMDLVTHAEPDVALVDIRLPDGSGIDLTRKLLRWRPELGLILCTSNNDADVLYWGLDSRARGYALKNASMAERVGAIERIADAGSYVDPRLDRILLSPRATSHVSHLSPRERAIMHLIAKGHTVEEVATTLGRDRRTNRFSRRLRRWVSAVEARSEQRPFSSYATGALVRYPPPPVGPGGYIRPATTGHRLPVHFAQLEGRTDVRAVAYLHAPKLAASTERSGITA